MSLIDQGILKKLISFSKDGQSINYINHNRPRKYSLPEEQVQAETFLKLVIDYGYSPNRIKMFVPVTMGSGKKEADIIVYNDDDCLIPHILVECKKQEVSEQEFLQAVEQAYSYAYALPNEIKYVWVTSGLKDEYFEVDKHKHTRVTQPDIPQFGVNKVANYKYVYDAESLKTATGKQKFFDLQVIEQSELTRRFKQAHDALWAGGQLNPSEAFDELDKLIFCKIWDERKDRLSGKPYDFQIITKDAEDYPDASKRRQQENKELYERIVVLYEEGRTKDPEVFRDNIRLTPEKIRTVVGYLQDINLGETDLDAKGRAFETFMDSFFRGNFGQYFTPRQIVKFATDVLPITNESRVLDTSCGSGGFLLYALNKVREQANSIYPNHKNDVKQNQKHYRFWHDFAEKNLYGIEINEQISRAAKMNMIIHDDGHTNVITADGLLDESAIESITKNRGFKFNSFDCIITNPPFGSTVRKNEKTYLGMFDFAKKTPDWLDVKESNIITTRDSQSTEILFIEQCYKFLKPNGYLAIVIPDGILTNSSLQYIRDGIDEKFRIVAVVSMPQTAFSATGAGVKSSVLFLKKNATSYMQKWQNKKLEIQYKIKKESNFIQRVKDWEKEKNENIKNLNGLDISDPTLSNAEIKQTEEYKNWKAEISADFTDKVNNLKEELNDLYKTTIREYLKDNPLEDYPIFMAIAEEIGYDATGKATNKNELEIISTELQKFINSI
ncbi:N-6 DNA methylase [Elizabethkingia anophelis]|nr:N-6 DNA methylase [Elizabethkingia anophelis]MDV2467222.1 N-6 DNA methylase [Elizabethkingia anophelis]MDV3529514.1 N-6 DNA methylase [Elizabethkingia anophelis]MDV3821267.1 N-6 DNA methylase [Elizabethkingia anophelis]MDV4034903.1 N-6 DNA methylase [Elizabethkingia anophelis]